MTNPVEGADAEDASIEYGCVEGIYALAQWWIDGEACTPPRVEGRFILRDGIALTTFHDRRTNVPRHSGTLFGRYRLDADSFEYGYDDALMVIHTEGGIVLGEQAPWAGMRKFSLAVADGGVRVRARDGDAQFDFSRAGFVYSEGGRPLRRWLRLNRRV